MFRSAFFFGLSPGFAVSAVAAVLAHGGVTDVRVGPTAAIGIATSADGATVYVVHESGLFKSTDGATTWHEMPVQ